MVDTNLVLTQYYSSPVFKKVIQKVAEGTSEKREDRETSILLRNRGVKLKSNLE